MVLMMQLQLSKRWKTEGLAPGIDLGIFSTFSGEKDNTGYNRGNVYTDNH